MGRSVTISSSARRGGIAQPGTLGILGARLGGNSTVGFGLDAFRIPAGMAHELNCKGRNTMPTLLVRNARTIATLDDGERELTDASLHVQDGRITWVGAHAELPAHLHAADEVIDARDHLVIPGMVNTHHHMFQSLTRAIPAVQNAELFGWLQGLYPIWAGLTPEMVRVSTQVAMAELLLSGCTTSSDHLYIYPNGVRLDDSIEAAQAIGMRFVACRGSMSVGQSQGGLPPDAVVEQEDAILKETQRLIETWHDSAHGSMVNVAVAPCSPFSVSRDLMRESASLARHYGVRLHTHLAENDHDLAYSREKFGCTPTQYAQDLGWLGPDVWHAHCVKLDDAGISLFAATRTGVAHCPCSNMRLASGIAPVRRMRDAGVPVGLGVDGCASNDAGHMVAEARQALLLARVGRAMQPAQTRMLNGEPRTFLGCDLGPAEMTARDALRLATRGGAEVLGRSDIGYLAAGQCADFALFDLNTLAFAGGAVHDPVGSLLLCASPQTAYTVVQGRVVVREGELTTVALRPLVAHHNRISLELVHGQ